MPSASFLFSAVLGFRKVKQEIFSELDEMKTQPPIFPTRTRSPKGRRRRATIQPHHVVAWPPSGCAGTWCGAHGRLWPSYFGLFIAPDAKNPKRMDYLSRKVPLCRCYWNLVSGGQKLCFGALPGRGIAPGAISIDSTTMFIDVAASHDEEGVVLPRGWGLYR